MTPNPSLGHEGQCDADAPADHPRDLEHRLGPGERLGPHVLGDVALDDRVGAQAMT